METLGLKRLEDDFIPKLPNELQDALGKEVRVTLGSFKKLVGRDRTKYIKELRPTLESPDMVFKDIYGGIVFAKRMDDAMYFTSVNKELETYFISVSNAPKTSNNILNKVKNGAAVIYQSNKPRVYSPEAFTDITSSTNKTDIPQNATTTPKISQE
ncbi:PBECR2 nuclease fold domain-containing protein, partial [Helicobacter sp. 11S02629-2]|uniref:PBECR2 nuclease fold domain-containing protein n=1 Tax=Helicobacter sp. 11S02629-2 TaxID=1476195 RepID=UPI002151A6FF